jgi:ABC-type transporter Mla MlaB component
MDREVEAEGPRPAAGTPGEVALSVDGPFDLPAALRVARALTEASDETLVRIDLTHVSQFDDCGVAMLGRALRVHRRAVVRGLRQHQVRLLHYLGVEGVGGSLVGPEPAWTS